MSQNTHGHQDASQRFQEQNAAEMTNSGSQSSVPAHQQAAQLPGQGISPAMLLPNQPFGTLLNPGGGSSGANTGFSNADGTANQGAFNELKRLQQLQQMGGAASNNTFMFPNTNPAPSPQLAPNTQLGQAQAAMQNTNQQAALLQSMFEQQKLQNNNFMGAAGALNPLFAQPGLLQDARLLLAQGQLGGLVAGQTNAAPEAPLPSPHSLFHRDGSRRMRGGVIEPFPEKLHRLLTEVEAAGRSDVISFVANGRAFAIHKPDKFFKEIVPLYFRQSRLSSFKRQLNLYGFELINTGPSRGGYFHELFVKDRPELCRRMRRVAVKVSSGKSEKEDGEDSTKGEDSEKGVAKPTDTVGDAASQLLGGGDQNDQHGGSGAADGLA